MPRVTTLGCALTGVVAAFLAGADDRFEATVAALASYAVAGELAGEVARGPGSFVVAFLDVLFHLDGEALAERARLEVHDAA